MLRQVLYFEQLSCRVYSILVDCRVLERDRVQVLQRLPHRWRVDRRHSNLEKIGRCRRPCPTMWQALETPERRKPLNESSQRQKNNNVESLRLSSKVPSRQLTTETFRFLRHGSPNHLFQSSANPRCSQSAGTEIAEKKNAAWSSENAAHSHWCSARRAQTEQWPQPPRPDRIRVHFV